MNAALNLFDVVALEHPVPENGLTRGQVGTLVEELGNGGFEVEFSDEEGRAYAFAALSPADVLKHVYAPNPATSVAELQRIVRGRSYDEEPVPEIYSEALDFRAASECFAPVRRLRKRDLRGLQWVARAQPPLKRLVELGQLVTIGSGANDPHKAYHLKQGV